MAMSSPGDRNFSACTRSLVDSKPHFAMRDCLCVVTAIRTQRYPAGGLQSRWGFRKEPYKPMGCAGHRTGDLTGVRKEDRPKSEVGLLEVTKV